MMAASRPLETEFFRALNLFVEPLVRAGVGSPGLFPAGAIVLETTGRKTGRRLSLPLLGTLVGDLAVVGTARPRSQWVRNVAARPQVRYWLLGRRREATAVVVAPGLDTSGAAGASQAAGCLASVLRPWTYTLGMSFAILAPARREVDAVA